jgi:hypothetical protein
MPTGARSPGIRLPSIAVQLRTDTGRTSTRRSPASCATVIGKRVTVFDLADGRLSICHKGVELAYRNFYKIRQIDHGAITDNNAWG